MNAVVAVIMVHVASLRSQCLFESWFAWRHIETKFKLDGKNTKHKFSYFMKEGTQISYYKKFQLLYQQSLKSLKVLN